MKADQSVLLHKLEPMIRKSLSDNRIVKEIEQIIGDYIDRNAIKLSTTGPVYRTVFLDAETNKFFEALKINPEAVKLILKESDYIKSQWQIMNNPFNSVAVFCIRHFRIKKDWHMMKAMIAYLTLSMYPSLHSKYFKYEPNKAIMDYTISNLSNKYKVKNSSTILQALLETTEFCDNTYQKDVIRATDKDVTQYVHAYKTRMNSLIKKIAIAFYENEKQGAYMNEQSDSNDEENFRSTDNDSMVIERIANSVVLKLATDGPDMKIVTLSAKICDISVNEIRNTTLNLCQDNSNRDDIRSIVSTILYLFIFDNHKPKEMIGSNNFYYFCMEIYKQANTTDKNVIKIKTTLDKWLNKYSATYKRSNRVGTLNNFRRALFTFIVFTIQQSSKS